MNMKLKEVAEMLQVSDKTIYRWVKDGKIPHRRINHQYRFDRSEIEDWCGSRKTAFYGANTGTPGMEIVEPGQATLLPRLRNGGIYYRIASPDMTSAISNAVNLINIPPLLERECLLDTLLRRESMAPTSMGRGVAFPHPREQIVSKVADESVSICFLESPVVGYGIDRDPIHTLVIILSARPETHLRIIARLSYLCGQDDFLELLRKQAARDDIFTYLENFPKWAE